MHLPILIEHLYLSGMQLGVTLKTDTNITSVCRDCIVCSKYDKSL